MHTLADTARYINNGGVATKVRHKILGQLALLESLIWDPSGTMVRSPGVSRECATICGKVYKILNVLSIHLAINLYKATIAILSEYYMYHYTNLTVVCESVSP